MSGAFSSPPFSEAAMTAIALLEPVAQRFVPSRGSTAMSTAKPPLPTFSPMNSMGASSRSPSPITMVPSMSTLSISRRMASTATWSEYLRSPWPIVWAQAMAAVSTTLTNSRNRSSRCMEVSRCVRLALVGRQLDASRLVLAVPKCVVRLHQLVDLPRALVDHGRLAVAVEAAGRGLVGEPVAAVDLDRVARRPLAGRRGEPLGERGLPVVAPSLVLEPARAQPEQPGRVVVGDHLGDHLLDQLMVTDRHADRLALAGGTDRGGQGGG